MVESYAKSEPGSEPDAFDTVQLGKYRMNGAISLSPGQLLSGATQWHELAGTNRRKATAVVKPPAGDDMPQN